MTPVDLFELVLAFLAIALVLSSGASRFCLPPSAALVLGGVALAFVPSVPAFDLDPGLILVLFLPPLLLSSAYGTVWRDFRAELRPILMMSVGAVVFTTLVVGLVARLVVPALPWAACFTLGAMVSPPDAVAAKAVLTRLRLPRRLLVILEGESLVNDASGLVLYRFAVAAAMTGGFSFTSAIGSFAWLAVGGIGIGVAIGLLVTALLRRASDATFMIALTFLSSWATYLAAERLEASGVLAVVACGLVFGWRQHDTLSAHTRVQAGAVWEVATAVLEAFVFVLIGLAARGILQRIGASPGGLGSVLRDEVPLALAATGAVIASRFLWVFPGILLPRLSRRRRERDPFPAAKAAFVVSWAGMRGVVSLAAALALPQTFPGRDEIILATFGVILVTVLGQGATLGPLIRWLRFDTATAARTREVGARLAMARAGLAALEALEVPDEPGRLLHPMLVEEHRRRVRAIARVESEGVSFAVTGRDHFAAALLALAAARAELLRLHRHNEIEGALVDELEHELDLEELRLSQMRQMLAARAGLDPAGATMPGGTAQSETEGSRIEAGFDQTGRVAASM